MGTAKDIIDLVTQLSDSIKDRKVASELFKIISLVNQLQSENTDLREKYFESQSQILQLQKEKQEIQQKLDDKNLKIIFHANLLWLLDDEQPYCPTCYDSDHKLIHMHNFDSPYFANDAIHTKSVLKCPKCNHIAEIIKHPKISAS